MWSFRPNLSETMSQKKKYEEYNFLPLCAMWTAELSVSSVDNTETHFLLIESTMNIIFILSGSNVDAIVNGRYNI